MIKLRQAQYCNLKLFLIFLVIYGHLIEPKIYNSDLLTAQYRWIYLIHMPMFSFLSGLFISRQKECLIQLTRTLPLYIILQTIAVTVRFGAVKAVTPWWHLWYLLSYCSWLCIALLWFKFCKGRGKFIILVCSVVIGCLAGLFNCIGREFSLSRTLVFFPYFWTGVILKPSFDWKKLRIAGIASLALALIIMVYVGDDIPVTFLYHACAYKTAGDILLRLLCYLLSGLLGLFLLTVIPTRRLPFSKLGANTMPAYLIHAPIVLCLRGLDYPWPLDAFIAVAFLYAVFIFTRLHGTIYGIVCKERRDNSGDLSTNISGTGSAGLSVSIVPDRQ